MERVSWGIQQFSKTGPSQGFKGQNMQNAQEKRELLTFSVEKLGFKEL